MKLRCQQDDSACKINKGRFKCQACRFKACIAAGMQRKEGMALKSRYLALNVICGYITEQCVFGRNVRLRLTLYAIELAHDNCVGSIGSCCKIVFVFGRET